MAGGYAGSLAFIDLSTGKIRKEGIADTTARSFLGGYGLGAELLYRHQGAKVDPLGENNHLGFLTGPLTGTSLPVVSRYTVVGKSPLTGLWGDANSRGAFGPTLKFAGFDGILVSGASSVPVYLVIQDGAITIRHAGDLWGKDTYETEDLLKSRHGKKAEIVCIGPAGEKRSLLAGVITAKGKAAARSGLGAVMGSKMLKAVVVMGSGNVPVAKPELLDELRQKYAKQLRDGTGFAGMYMTTGTPGYIETGALNGDSPVGGWFGIGARDLKETGSYKFENIEKYIVRKGTCIHCVMGDWKHVKVESGPFAVPTEVHVPEYETASAFGSYCNNTNFESIIKCNDICNRFGMDTISAGATIAFAMKCFDEGIISQRDTGGIDLRWGDSSALVAMLEKMVRREGFGDVLADGVKRAAERIGKGSERFAVHVGGQELPAHDSRFEPSMASIYINDATPGRHGQASQYCVPPKLAEMKKEIDFSFSFGNKRDVYSGRAKAQRILSNLYHSMSSLGMCLWGYLSTEVTFMSECCSAVTGWDVDLDELITSGERIGTMRLAFNFREGVTPKMLSYPTIALGAPPLADGPTKNISVDLETLCREYYAEMDWDWTTGKPSQKRLQELGLGWLAKEIAEG